MMQTVGIERGEKVYFEDFELFFYYIFKDLDKLERYQRIYVVSSDNTKRWRIVKIPGKKRSERSNYFNTKSSSCALI